MIPTTILCRSNKILPVIASEFQPSMLKFTIEAPTFKRCPMPCEWGHPSPFCTAIRSTFATFFAHLKCESSQELAFLLSFSYFFCLSIGSDGDGRNFTLDRDIFPTSGWSRACQSQRNYKISVSCERILFRANNKIKSRKIGVPSSDCLCHKTDINININGDEGIDTYS